MTNRIHLTGKRFGRWTVRHVSHHDKHNHLHWNCICDCGNEKTVEGNSLNRGTSYSCGCFRKENPYRKHGMSNTPTFKSWVKMIERCTDFNCKDYRNYGDRGIVVCPEWKNSFKTFYRDMGERPEGLTLDRIDNNGNYEPGNCRWATRKQQNNNTRSNVLLEFRGIILTAAQWAEKLGITSNILQYKVRKNNLPDGFKLINK